MGKRFFRLRLSTLLFTLSFSGVLLFALGLPVNAQRPARIPRIGYLAGGGSAPHPALIQALRELGYVEGKNIGLY